MTVIQTYRILGHWCVRVHGAALVGHFKTRKAAEAHGKWYLETQV